MDSPSLPAVIFEVLKTWQVIAVTIIAFAYWGILNMVTNPSPPKTKSKKPKTEKIKRPKEPDGKLGKNVDDSGLDLGE
ncbi:MAG: hypothetical protein LBG74_08650 [Spirochaetaceae bacterium]|jgi:hypothetical protein|nr:hypothetical protein [Spirochaetaceae bacterium]